ncbi:MAG TPA: hypothetical protein VIP05_12870 [Burkholderiaceae bacterium]
MTDAEPSVLADAGPAARSAVTFLRWIGGTFAVLAALNIGLSLRFGAIGGDLARLGGFAERDYAPGVPQPTPRIAPNTVALEDADVVVLGDSFSNRLVWQGELEAMTGQRTLTFQYGEAGCISNWLQWIHAQRLKPGALVVIETVERSYVQRFAQLTTCPQVTPLPMRRHLPVDKKSWMDSGLSLDIVYQARVLMNTARLGSQTSYRAGETVNAALKRSDRFTARRADRLLYHADDEAKDNWRAPQLASALARLSQEQAAFAASGQRFQMLVIPDKSSVYLEDLVEPRMRPVTLTRDLQQAGLSPVDTRACFRTLATTMPDFYLPDDMHVGVNADRLIADQVAHGRCAAPPAATAVN